MELALGDGLAGATITNTARIRGLDADGSWWNNLATAVDQVNEPGANLRLRKSANWEGAEWIRFELQFENVGTIAVDNVRITDTLPVGLEFNGDAWANWWRDLNREPLNPVTREIVWTTSRLEPSWSGSINFRVRVPAPVEQGLVFTNTAQITVPLGELTEADNSATAIAFTGPDLYISKSLTGGDLVPGGLVTFTISLGNRNNGPWDTGFPPQNQPGIFITDTLPAEMSIRVCHRSLLPGPGMAAREGRQ